MNDVDLPEWRQVLRDTVRGDVSFDPYLLGIYATDASHYQIMPKGLVVPRDRADVEAVVRIAQRYTLTLLPRGGGTSLGGQAVGDALVVDFSKYMNRILELNVAERWVRVEPGIVRDELNAVLAEHGLHFAPDPATTSRANIGGMIANDSSGMRSILYGKTVDHVLSLDVLLADGTAMPLEALDAEAWNIRAQSGGREGEIYSGVARIVAANREEIRTRYPKVKRRVGGYHLDEFDDDGCWNLARLVTGSEGTLAVICEAKLNLEPLPAATALCVAHFADLMEALRAVEPVVARGPSAVEILDGVVLSMAKNNRLSAPICGFIEGEPAAVLIIEFFGQSAEDVEQKARDMGRSLREAGYGYAYPVMLDKQAQADVWTVRKNGLGLMQDVKGPRQPTAFIEDAAVPLSVLPEYIDRVLAICKRHGVAASMYAHASVGVIHVRPLLDLHQQADIDLMKTISRETFDLVCEYGGSWSSEHGDGLVRSAYNEEFFGPALYEAFKSIKRLFDPEHRLNPGKIVDGPPLDADLRYGPAYAGSAFKSYYHYRDDGGILAAIERCTGVGQCRKTATGVMCPSYMATRDEAHSTRGRANALRLAMTNQLGPDAMTSDALFALMDLCLSCKACKSECPSNVDMARLKSEVLQHHHDRHGPTLRDRMVAGSRRMAEWFSGPLAPLVNAMMGARPVRALLEKTAGFSRHRPLPPYARRSLKTLLRARQARAAAQRQVVLFADTYLSFYEPGVGISAIELLESCGYEVIVAHAGCCQRPRISHGFLKLAKRDGLKTLQNLDQYARKGLPIVVCEPSCASALTDDLPDLIEDEALGQRIRDHVTMIDVFLAEELEAGRLDSGFRSPVSSVMIHGHCHQKSLYGTRAMKALLSRVPGLSVREIDTGCCGMAGSFGYEKEHAELSERIAEDRLLPALRDAEEGTAVVACGFSCRHQIQLLGERRAVHWVEVLRGDSGEDAGAP